MSDGVTNIKMKKNEILFLEGDSECDMYYIKSGKVMVFVQKGSQITPIAYLNAGEYIGELSFFDNEDRSASVICIEDSEFKKIPVSEIDQNCPGWLKILGQQLTKKIRSADETIKIKGIRKQNTESIKALPIEEQTGFFKLVEAFQKKRN